MPTLVLNEGRLFKARKHQTGKVFFKERIKLKNSVKYIRRNDKGHKQKQTPTFEGFASASSKVITMHY